MIILIVLLILSIIYIIICEFRKRELKKQIRGNTNSGLVVSTLVKWLENKDNGFNISKYLIENGYKDVAIYGLGDIGKLLYRELSNTEVNIKFFVDRNYESMDLIEKIPVVSPEKIEDVDVVIVSPIMSYNDIAEEIVRINPKIATLSLRDIMFEIE